MEEVVTAVAACVGGGGAGVGVVHLPPKYPKSPPASSTSQSSIVQTGRAVQKLPWKMENGIFELWSRRLLRRWETILFSSPHPPPP